MWTEAVLSLSNMISHEKAIAAYVIATLAALCLLGGSVLTLRGRSEAKGESLICCIFAFFQMFQV